jgi:hypothetical protein
MEKKMESMEMILFSKPRYVPRVYLGVQIAILETS